MAPSTPPPPSSAWLAALTMASTSRVVMSATQISSRAVPTSAVRRGALMQPMVAQSAAQRSAAAATLARLDQFRLGLRGKIDAAPPPDVARGGGEEAPRRPLPLAAARFHVFVAGFC